MNTTKLVSTIAYNTPDFLAGKLRDLVRQGIIEYAHWIQHKAEEDEKKDHFHLVLKPNKRLNTGALQNEFKETVAGEDKPRGVLPFQSSKMQDWILYAVHDRAYLIRKNKQMRKFQYEKGDIRTTEPDLLDEDWKDAHEGEDTRIGQIIDLAKKGITWKDVLQMGIIPTNQLFQFREVFFTFYETEENTQRNGRKGHEDEKS